MMTRTVVAFCAFLLTLPLSAQTTTQPAIVPAISPAAASPASVVGELTGDNVNIRSGPSTSGGYPCTKLSRGAKVTVVEAKGDWLKILPPQGSHSVIAKQYVTVDASGNGTVSGEHVWVRAAGDQCKWDKVVDFWQLHRQLNTGDKVTVIGQAGDFYRITPPNGSYFWIAGKFVDLKGATPAERTEEVIGDGTVQIRTVRNESQAAEAEIIARAPATAPASNEPVIDPSAARAEFLAVEKEMRAEYAKPADQRDLKVIVAKFQAINAAQDQSLKAALNYYVKYLQSQLDQYKEAKDIERIAREAKENVNAALVQVSQITIKETARPRVTAYAADGVLTASGLFPGTAATPKRWVVRDPDTSRITAYVQCTNSDVDLSTYVDKHVGVTGSSNYDKDLGLYIVEAKEVKVLKDAAALPPPPQPEVQAAPKSEETVIDVAAKPEPAVEVPAAAKDEGPSKEPAAAPEAAPAATPEKGDSPAAAAPAQDSKPDMSADGAANVAPGA